MFARWKRCRVAPDYHVEIDGHWYSTPYRLIRELVDVRIADKTVEIFHKGQRITSHARAPNRRGHTTIADHMPSAHRRYGKWTPGGLIAAGERIGPSTAAFFQAVIAARHCRSSWPATGCRGRCESLVRDEVVAKYLPMSRARYPCQPTFAAAADFLFRAPRAFGFGAAAGAAWEVVS